MNISIIGASGFLGQKLISYLLKNTNYNVCAIAPDPLNIIVESKYRSRVKIMKADALNLNEMKIALVGTDVAFYFVHMLYHKGDFYKKESKAAHIVGKALQETGVKKIIYMSGLGNDQEELSEHLASRHNTGKILREYVPQVIEFRASMIIGEGSASFEIVRSIIKRAPIILLPRTALNKTQPIGINDTLLYLSSSINLNIGKSIIIEIGGKEVMSYKKFIQKYNDFIKQKKRIIVTRFIGGKTAGLFLDFFTSKNNAIIGQNMINSFKNEMIVTNNIAHKLFPEITPKKVEDSFI